jgi:hypothetical protein
MVLPNVPPDTNLSDALVATGMSLYVIDIMLAMSAFSNSLEYAIEHELTIPSRCFDEETMGIQYDLLVMRNDMASEIDVACRSAALMYMKSLTREDPCNFDAIVDPMVDSLENIRITSSNAGLLFWISLMGAMTAQNITKRIWFQEQLAVHRELLSLIDWNEAEALLHEFSWISRIHGKTGRLVWDVIEHKSPSLIFTQKLTPPLTPPPST